jgi:hypothetical protein
VLPLRAARDTSTRLVNSSHVRRVDFGLRVQWHSWFGHGVADRSPPRRAHGRNVSHRRQNGRVRWPVQLGGVDIYP